MAATLYCTGPGHTREASCTSTTCHSPLRLWRSIQAMIHANDLDGFRQQGRDTPSVLLRVLLEQRLPNDASLYPASQKHRMLQFDSSVRSDATATFGKALTDLNAVQIALVLKQEAMAMSILDFIRRHATTMDQQRFVQHRWGYNNTSLHLACFFSMPRVVQLLLSLGAEPETRNRRGLQPKDCCRGRSHCLGLLQRTVSPPVDHPVVELTTKAAVTLSPPKTQPCPQVITIIGPHRPSMLLKKAIIKDTQVSLATALDLDHTPLPEPVPLPLSVPADTSHEVCTTMVTRADTGFKKAAFVLASSSSSSSFSSLSSVETPSRNSTPDHEDRCWSPMLSPSPSPSPATDPTLVPPPAETRRIKKAVRFDPKAVLVDACIHGDLAEVDKIFNQAKQVPGEVEQLQSIISHAHHRSLLHLALLHGNENVARYLVSVANIDINHLDYDGWSALHYSVALGLWKSVEFLASQPNMELHVRTRGGLTINDCARTETDRRKCYALMERALKKRAASAPLIPSQPPMAVAMSAIHTRLRSVS